MMVVMTLVIIKKSLITRMINDDNEKEYIGNDDDNADYFDEGGDDRCDK